MSNAHGDMMKDMDQSIRQLCECNDKCGEDVPEHVTDCSGVVKCLLEKAKEFANDLIKDKPEVKPCPFCGDDAGVVSSDHYVGCMNPRCWIFGYACSPTEWNTREWNE